MGRYSVSPAITTSPSNCAPLIRQPINSSPCPSFFKLVSFSKKSSHFSFPSLKISQPKVESPKRSYRLLVVSGLVGGNSETYPEAEAEPRESNAGATIDIKLPRRSLLVQFTCDDCGERTQRLINRLAYERGLVYVQCAGCERYHKLADNLGLVVEYDLREEINIEPNSDQDV